MKSELLPGSTLTATGVKRAIKNKFKSFNRFCKLARVDRYEDFQKFFAAYEKKKTPERYLHLEHLDNLRKLTDNKKLVDTEMTPARIKLVKAAIKIRGGRLEFCRKNKKFSPQTVWQVMNGSRRFISKKVRALLDHLNIK